MSARIRLFLLLFSAPLVLFAQNDTVNELNANGEKQGVWIEKYPGGSKKSETTYVNGEKRGIERIYREDGKILSEITYAGERHKQKNPKPRSIFLPPEPRHYFIVGHEKRYGYDKNGNLEEISFFKDGLKDSISLLYYPTGELKAEGFFKYGKAHGQVKSYFKDGKLQSDCHYKYGKKDSIQTYYYPNGQISYIGLTMNGKREGTHVFMHENGKLWQEIIFKNDMPWEVLTNYDPDGKAVEMGTLKDGNGTLYIYEENGKLSEIETYVNGVKVTSNNNPEKATIKARKKKAGR